MKQLFTNKNDNKKNIDTCMLRPKINDNYQDTYQQQIRINQQIADQMRFYDQNISRETQLIRSKQKLYNQNLISNRNVLSGQSIVYQTIKNHMKLGQQSIVYKHMQDQLNQRLVQQKNKEQKLLIKEHKAQIVQLHQRELQKELERFKNPLDFYLFEKYNDYYDDDAVSIITDVSEFLPDIVVRSDYDDSVIRDISDISDVSWFKTNNKFLKSLFVNKNYNELVEKLNIQIKNRDFINSDDKCCICFDSNYNFISSCKHCYCLDCFLVWKIDHSKNICAYCKQIINTEESVCFMPFLNKN